jgi:hypothetical protein
MTAQPPQDLELHGLARRCLTYKGSVADGRLGNSRALAPRLRREHKAHVAMNLEPA